MLVVIHLYLELITTEHNDWISWGHFVDHPLATKKRILVFALSGVVMLLYANLAFALIGVYFLVAYWWIMFDLRLNLKRSLDWDYIGENAEIDIWFREVFLKNTERMMVIVKVASILIAIGLFLFYFTGVENNYNELKIV